MGRPGPYPLLTLKSAWSMIALLAQLADWFWSLGFLAWVGLLTVGCVLSLTALFGCGWCLAEREARRGIREAVEREKRDAEMVARWQANEDRRWQERRDVANEGMLSQLTPEDHAEVRRIIHDSQTEAA